MKEEIREFLETGLLEMYVLGLTDPADTQLVEDYIGKYPEIREIYDSLQTGVEKLAKEASVSPPPEVKQHVMKTIRNTGNPKSSGIGSGWLLAAAVAVVLSSSWGILQMMSLDETKAQLATVKQTFETLKKDCEERQAKLAVAETKLNFINDPGTERYYLEGNKKASEFKTIAYWNNSLEKSMLQVLDLPALPENKCFQMWADVDGKMLNLGIIANSKDGLPIDWKFLAKAESLNVTIEPEGGSEHPTVANLVANIAI